MTTNLSANSLFCPLDLPGVYLIAKNLNELCPRQGLTKLLDIFKNRNSNRKQFIRNLESLILSRIAKAKPILPTRSNQKYGIHISKKTFQQSLKASEKLNQSIDVMILAAQLEASISNNLSLGRNLTDAIYISTEEIDETDRHIISIDQGELRATISLIMSTSMVYASQWINISFKHLYPGNDFGENTVDIMNMLTKLSNYYIATNNNRTYGLNMSLEDIIKHFATSSISIESEFALGTFKVNIDYDKLPKELHQFAKSVDQIDIKSVFKYSSLATLESSDWHIMLSHIVHVFHTPGRKEDIERIALCCALYGGFLVFDRTKLVPYHEYFSDAMVEKVARLIMKYDYISISAQKGSGKSRLTEIMPSEYLVIDSDVRGQFYNALMDPVNSSLLESVKKGATSDKGVLDLLYKIILEADDEAPSAFELAAHVYVTENKISISEAMNSLSMKNHYKRFGVIYKKLNAITDKGSCTFVNMCNALVQHASKYYNRQYKKIVQFFHNASELYGSMSPAIFSMQVNINTIPIHILRERATSPTVQIFLCGFYLYHDTFAATQVNLFELQKAFEFATRAIASG